jgi:hypothetical protein
MGPIELEAYVLLHSGYQVVAKQFREDVENPLLTVLVQSPKWRPSSIRALPAPRADWFDAFWHYRIPITVSVPAGAPPFTEAEIRWGALLPGKKVDEGSLRLIRLDAKTNAWTQVPFAFDKDQGKLRWRVDGAPQGSLFLYFDLESNGPKPAGRQASVGRISIEANTPLRESDEWTLAQAEVQPKAGPDGREAVRLLCPEKSAYSLLSNHAIFALPKARYKVSFMARAQQAVTVFTNLYSGAHYDFTHGVIPVTPGNDWRRYEVFRIWVTDKDKEVFLSGLSIQPVLPQGAPTVSLGRVESVQGK